MWFGEDSVHITCDQFWGFFPIPLVYHFGYMWKGGCRYCVIRVHCGSWLLSAPQCVHCVMSAGVQSVRMGSSYIMWSEMMSYRPIHSIRLNCVCLVYSIRLNSTCPVCWLGWTADLCLITCLAHNHLLLCVIVFLWLWQHGPAARHGRRGGGVGH